MSRTRTLAAFALMLLLAPLVRFGQGGQPKSTPTPKPSPTPTAAVAKPTPRVFTNDDLEAGKDKPSAVQDLKATGTEPYEPPAEAPKPPPEETPEPDPQAQRLAQAEARVKELDESAKALLWQYLQSTDSNEILRLKAEQQEILSELEAAKADLARLRGEAGTPAEPTATPTPPPG